MSGARFHRRAALIAALVGGLGACRPAPDATALSDQALDRAIEYVDSIRARDPENPILSAQLAGRLVLRFGRTADLADLARAESLAMAARRLARDTAGAAARVAGIRLMRHDFAGAVAAAREAVAANPGSSDAHAALLEASVAAGDTVAAAQAAARLDRRSVEGQIRYALWLDARGHSEAAVRQLARACATLERSGGLADGVAWCWAQRATLVRALRGPDEAKALYQEVLARYPGARAAAEGLAAIAFAAGDGAEAARRLEPLLSDAHPDLYLRMAEILRRQGEPVAAARMTDRFLAAATAPGSEPLFGNLLALHYLESDSPALRDSALALAERDVARRPTVDAWDLLAWIQLRRGNAPAALEASDRAAASGPRTPAGGYHRARILEALGRPAEAARLRAEVLERRDLLPPYLLRDLAADGSRATSATLAGK